MSLLGSARGKWTRVEDAVEHEQQRDGKVGQVERQERLEVGTGQLRVFEHVKENHKDNCADVRAIGNAQRTEEIAVLLAQETDCGVDEEWELQKELK